MSTFVLILPSHFYIIEHLMFPIISFGEFCFTSESHGLTINLAVYFNLLQKCDGDYKRLNRLGFLAYKLEHCRDAPAT